jgi:hypothetical protein
MLKARRTRPLGGEEAPAVPDGFSYELAMLSVEEELALLARFSELPLREFEFHGYLGKRRTLSFGWAYDFTGLGLRKAEEMPPYLLGARERAAKLAGVAASDLQHALVTEYPPGAGLGWHKDKGVAPWSGSRSSRPATSGSAGRKRAAAGSAGPSCSSRGQAIF